VTRIISTPIQRIVSVAAKPRSSGMTASRRVPSTTPMVLPMPPTSTMKNQTKVHSGLTRSAFTVRW
jgi:hypothetical protein